MGVRHAARLEAQAVRPEPELLVAHEEDVLAREDVEELVLVRVDVSKGSRSSMIVKAPAVVSADARTRNSAPLKRST